MNTFRSYKYINTMRLISTTSCWKIWWILAFQTSHIRNSRTSIVVSDFSYHCLRLSTILPAFHFQCQFKPQQYAFQTCLKNTQFPNKCYVISSVIRHSEHLLSLERPIYCRESQVKILCLIHIQIKYLILLGIFTFQRALNHQEGSLKQHCFNKER